MSVFSFRVSIPAATPANAPVEVKLTPQARAIQELVIWSTSTNMTIDKAGFRLLDYGSSKVFVPDSGSNDNNVIAASGESGWAPIPPDTLRLAMHDQLVEGPPYKLTFQFYNKDAALILVAGFVVMHEPAVKLDASMLYEIITAKNPPAEYMQGKEISFLDKLPEKTIRKSQTVRPPGAK